LGSAPKYRENKKELGSAPKYRENRKEKGKKKLYCVVSIIIKIN
jgi:hypothetical protein